MRGGRCLCDDVKMMCALTVQIDFEGSRGRDENSVVGTPYVCMLAARSIF